MTPSLQVLQDSLQEAGVAATDEAIRWLQYPDSVQILIRWGAYADTVFGCPECDSGKMELDFGGSTYSDNILHERKCAYVDALYLLKRPELQRIIDYAHAAALDGQEDIERLRRPITHWADAAIEEQERIGPTAAAVRHTASLRRHNLNGLAGTDKETLEEVQEALLARDNDASDYDIY